MPLTAVGKTSSAKKGSVVTPVKVAVNPISTSSTDTAPTPISNVMSGVGDVLRTITQTVTDGHFGNGNAKQKQGETQAEYYNRLAQAAGAAVETFNNTSKNPSKSSDMAESLKAGVTAEAISNAVKTYAPIVIIGTLGVVIVKKFILKKGSKRRRY